MISAKKRFGAWLAALLVVAVPALAAAQATTGSISGTVVDESKAVLPGVTVTVRNVETGLERSQVSDQQGRYRVLNLPPGTYIATAELQGFAPVQRADLTVAIGRDVVADMELKIGGITEQITVAGETSSVSLGTTTVGGVVTTQQIAELPLNGRSFTQLATLQPGVVVSRATARDFTGGFGSTQLAIGGARPEQTGYLMDGTNIADISDKAPSSLSGVLLGVDTVQEFSVQTHGYSAEFGRAAGGIMSAVTKSGTNRLRGSLFEFHRNDSMDSRNFFAEGELPDFRRDQYGGSIGGPILKNRLFFFGAYEALRERNAVTQFARLPNALAHQGRVPNAQGVLTTVTVHPTVRPYLDLLFPIPTGRDFGDGTAELAHSHQDPTDEHFGVGKIDWNFGKRGSTFMVRWSRDVSDTKLSQPHPLFFEEIGTETRYFTTQLQQVLSNKLLNSLKFAANRTGRDNDLIPTIDIPTSLYFTEDPHWGAIEITGVSTAGSIATIPVDYKQDIFQLSDTVTYTANSHVLKTGFDWQKYHFDGFSYSRYGGAFRFRNLTEFLTLRRSSTAQADRFTGNLPGTDTFRQMRQHYAAFFVQDDWRVSDDLSLNLGVRYEFVTTPKELNGQVAGLLSLDHLESPPFGVTPGSPIFKNPSKKSLAPRLGAAWNPFGDKDTTIKAGYGLFYQPLTTSYYRGTTFRIYPYFAGVDIRQPAVFGPGMKAVLAAGVNPDTVQKRSEFIFYDAKQPYMQQWHVNMERGLGWNMVGEIGYIGSKGHNLPFYGDPNTTPSFYDENGVKRLVPGAGLRYPSWGRIRTRINEARSIYHGLTAGVNKRFSDGWQMQVSYTLGDAKDTWSGGLIGGSDFDNGAGSATDWWDPEYEFGPSNYDVRHNLVINGVWVLPIGRDLTGFAGALAKGWQVGGVLQFSSGLPFTPFLSYDQVGDRQSDTGVQKPNVSGSVSYPKTADQWFDPSAFSVPAPGVFGNARRNSLRAPGVKIADLSLFKNVQVGRVQGQIRLEAFNAFNWVNLGLPDATIFNAGGVRNPTAGRIRSTSTPARQLQLGFKLNF
ncbi:MAG TPA: TonB-dependent receptor [Vicinamibacterales bacterium]|nr:TonB-dependent receptor [Vicinamibacterales bacterium]